MFYFLCKDINQKDLINILLTVHWVQTSKGYKLRLNCLNIIMCLFRCQMSQKDTLIKEKERIIAPWRS